ncbi:uncharacterized protein [Oscarella lobularis]|uniref:uncharacterized protein n=1 Tax=Oscarella lobularis TaxID=121494 RepID=UPI003313AB67
MQIGIALLALLAASALGQNDEGRLLETSEEEIEAELENELKRLNTESTDTILAAPTKESSTKPLYEKPVAESPTQCTCPPALPLATASCTAQFEGYVRYNAAIDDVEYCTKGSWSGAKPEYGSERNPATSCQSLYDAGRTDDGIFYLKPKPSTPVFKVNENLYTARFRDVFFSI